MAIAHVGSGTVLHETSLPDAVEKKSTEFADSRASRGTVVTCVAVGSGGTLKVYKKMKGSGNYVEISSDAVTAGLTTPLVVDFAFPVGLGQASLRPRLTGM